MKNKILSVGIVLLNLVASLGAVDIKGRWIAYLPAKAETIFSFKMEGTVLTGTVTNPQGEAAIRDGRIRGDEISFIVFRNFDGNKVKQLYKGKVVGDEIKFTCEMKGVVLGSGLGGGQPQEFVAKREFQRNGDIPVQPLRRIN